jgi:hypothetical protein
MIVSTDLDYLDTKLVKQGLKKLDPIFQELACWMQKKYASKLLNVYYDKIENNRPRLNIIFEFGEDTDKFKDNRGNFMTDRQKAAKEKFEKILLSDPEKDKNFFSRIFTKSKPAVFDSVEKSKFDTDDLLVVFDTFEPVAKNEMNKNISQAQIDNLERELKTKNVWKIYREFSTTAIFFYTNDQIDQSSRDGTKDFIKEKYFELLKSYDEFNYLKAHDTFLTFDSKENFEEKYQGNWFYYCKR